MVACPPKREARRREDCLRHDTGNRVLVSARFNGNPEAERHFLPYASRELLGPQPGQPRPAPEFRKWHRENCFRGPERVAEKKVRSAGDCHQNLLASRMTTGGIRDTFPG
jgi:hypothetical protein